MRNILSVFLLLAATATTAPDSPSKVVDQAIDHAGGWKAYTATRTIQFRKTIVRFAADGTATDTRVQFHRYVLNPSPKMRIEWEDHGSKIVLINDGHQAWKLVDGKIATAQEDINSARNSTFGSHYVFCMPFKLRDPGAELTDTGTELLTGGQRVRKIRVTYAPGVGDAGGFHTWTYSFDTASGRLVANHLLYSPGKYDYTEYYDERIIGALILPTRRIGYAADAKGKTGPKQSETTYDEIAANVDLRADLFAPPASVTVPH